MVFQANKTPVPRIPRDLGISYRPPAALTMPLSTRYAPQCIARTIRPSSSLLQTRIARRANSSEAAPNPKIAGIVEKISHLTLLETADLVSTLKSRFNIPDMPVGFAASAAPVAMPAAADEQAEEAAPAAPEKTLFRVRLMSFEAAAKPKIIKEIKSLLGLSLVDSKKFVESAPKTMKESVPKDEAEKMAATLKELGATVVME